MYAVWLLVVSYCILVYYREVKGEAMAEWSARGGSDREDFGSCFAASCEYSVIAE